MLCFKLLSDFVFVLFDFDGSGAPAAGSFLFLFCYVFVYLTNRFAYATGFSRMLLFFPPEELVSFMQISPGQRFCGYISIHPLPVARYGAWKKYPWKYPRRVFADFIHPRCQPWIICPSMSIHDEHLNVHVHPWHFFCRWNLVFRLKTALFWLRPIEFRVTPIFLRKIEWFLTILEMF